MVYCKIVSRTGYPRKIIQQQKGTKMNKYFWRKSLDRLKRALLKARYHHTIFNKKNAVKNSQETKGHCY